MGTLFGVLLAEAGHHITMLDKNAERAEALTKKPFQLEGISGEHSVSIPVSADPREIGQSETILVWVKAYDTRGAAQAIAPFVGKNTLVITLQNGLGNSEILGEVLKTDNLLAGSTAQGANVLEPGRVVHAGIGDTHIGELHGPATDRAKKICDLLTGAGIPASPSDDVQGLVWGKLVVNVGINPFTGLLQMRNGELLEHPETMQLMEMAVNEAVAVAKAAGVSLPFADPLDRVRDVARKTGQNRSSMYQDVAHHRRTEIDFICGAVVREGEKLGVPTPVNRTLTLLVRSICP